VNCRKTALTVVELKGISFDRVFTQPDGLQGLRFLRRPKTSLTGADLSAAYLKQVFASPENSADRR